MEGLYRLQRSLLQEFVATPPVVVPDARKTYPAADAPVRALDGVSLEVNRGEMVALVGPSGCGKSTLLNLVGCVDLPTSGHVYVDGRDTAQLDDNALTLLRRDRVGTVFQFFNLLPALSIEANVALPLVLQGVAAAEIAQRVAPALAAVGLSDKARDDSSPGRALGRRADGQPRLAQRRKRLASAAFAGRRRTGDSHGDPQ